MKRRVALVNEIPHEKVYFACLMLGLRNTSTAEVGWVSIDQLHKYLKNNQKLAADTKGRLGMDHALWPPEMYPLGWDEDMFVGILADLYQKGFLSNERRDEGNFFQCIHPEKHGLYQLRDVSKYDAVIAKAVRHNTPQEKTP